jgi:hypothetical protein
MTYRQLEPSGRGQREGALRLRLRHRTSGVSRWAVHACAVHGRGTYLG